MSRDDEKPDLTPGDDGEQGQRWDFDPEKLPNDPSSIRDDGYERGAGTDRGDQGSAPGRYRPTSHPEDAPGGFSSHYGAPGGAGAIGPDHSGYQPYPGNPDENAYGAYGGYGGYNNDGTPGQGGVALESTGGKVNVVRAVRFGFKAVFSNPAVWILGTVVIGLLFIVLSVILGFLMVAFDAEAVMNNDPFAPTSIILNVVMSVLGWAIAICVMRGALIETDGRRARLRDFFHPINVGQTIILMIVFTVISIVVSTAIQADTAELFVGNVETGEITVDSGALGLMALFLAVAGLLTPLYTYWTYYTSDGRETAMGAARHGLADAARNYPKLLAYSVLSTLVIFVVGPLTLLLGFVVLLPASMLIAAHLYRQMSGGNVPVEVWN